MPSASRFFQIPTLGNLAKSEPVWEHRQCLLFFTEKVPAFFGIAEKL